MYTTKTILVFFYLFLSAFLKQITDLYIVIPNF